MRDGIRRLRPPAPRRPPHGLTLNELLVAVALLAAVAAIAAPSYRGYLERTRTAQAVRDLRAIEAAVRLFRTDRGRYPVSLAEAGAARADPWGRPYEYLPLEDVRALGRARKDRALNPINTDFDLYSLGPDGRSAPALNARFSRDDIVRGRDGAFVGVADDF